MKVKILKINTKSKNYKIFIGSNSTIYLKKILNKEKIKFNKVLIVTDKKLKNIFLKRIKSSLNDKDIFTFEFQSSEKNKNLIFANKILNYLLLNNFTREDCIIALGGGIIGDLTCFVASIYKRGMKFINIPTTLLAQVDASIGGKSGINQKEFGKNLIGTFFQPDLVVSDTSFLKTLNKKQILCGYAEILKHSLIYDISMFNFLDKNLKKILKLKKPYIEEAILKSCNVKKQIVEKDEKEKNIRKLLNLGHTFGHAFEANRNFKGDIAHGEAVLLGITSAINFALIENILKTKDHKIIEAHINKTGFRKKLRKLFNKKDINSLIGYMKNDKKNKSRDINLILLKSIGKGLIGNNYKVSKIRNFFSSELTN